MKGKKIMNRAVCKHIETRQEYIMNTLVRGSKCTISDYQNTGDIFDCH